MKFQVKSTVPTGFQLNSLKTLMGSFIGHVDGSYSATMEFDTKEEAKNFLHHRLSVIFNETDMNDDKYQELLQDIDIYGSLHYDAAVAQIEICGE